jgi:uncharacterized protein YdeI (YjbR/CyaY-like superfamily)
MALYGCETKEYKTFSKDNGLKILKAIKSKSNIQKMDGTETPENLIKRFNNDKDAANVFAKMRPSCQMRYINRVAQIKNTPNEISKMNTIIREIIRYGKNHKLLDSKIE